jgi:hypothetical protein
VKQVRTVSHFVTAQVAFIRGLLGTATILGRTLHQHLEFARRAAIIADKGREQKPSVSPGNSKRPLVP